MAELLKCDDRYFNMDFVKDIAIFGDKSAQVTVANTERLSRDLHLFRALDRVYRCQNLRMASRNELNGLTKDSNQVPSK